MFVTVGGGLYPVNLTWAQEVAEELPEGEEEKEEEEDLEGFEDEDGFDDFGDGEDDGFAEIKIDVQAVPATETKSYSLGGFIREELAYSYLKPASEFAFVREEAELSKIRTVLNLSFDWKINKDWKLKISGNAFYDDYYRQKGRDDFPDETLVTT